MKLLLNCTVGWLLSVSLSTSAFSFYHLHQHWQRVLDKFVVQIGQSGAKTAVKYALLKQFPQALEQYLAEVQALKPEEYKLFSEAEQLAFLVNAYNALTLKLIIDHYPVKSIKDIGGLFSSPWKKEFFSLLGQKHHLDYIEHEGIRKNFNEPRIHFALVCAAKSCPALRKQAYLPGTLDKQLEEAALGFLKDPTNNRFDTEQKKLFLSSIFKWYGDDFVKKYGSVKAYVATRIASTQAQSEQIQSSDVKIEHVDYSWALNEA